MIRSAVWCVVVLAGVFGAPVARAQGGPPKPTELKVLDRFVGSWDTVVDFKQSVWHPEEKTVKGRVSSAWVLDGRFVEENGRSLAEQVEHKAIFTYDPRKTAYKTWYFDSVGVAGEWTGQWDEATKTLTSKIDLADGINGVSTYHFTDADHYEVTVVAKDGDGKVYMDIRARHTRKKSS